MQRPKVSGAGTLLYPYTLPDGSGVEIPQRRILHIRGLSDDGLWGYAPLTVFREAFGVALAIREFEARFYGQGARPGGVLQTAGKLSPGAAERLATSWRSAHEGLSMAHRVAVLEEGVEWKSIGMSQEDAQFAESANFSIAEMARIWNVKRHKIQDLTESSYNNIEQETISHVTDTVQPWVERWEQQLLKDLFLDTEKTRFYPKFMLNGLLRGDMTARKGFYEALFDRAVFSPNDIRELEDMDLIDDPSGDDRYHQQTMVVAGEEPVLAPAGVST
jgi:HK97 family phage portal protein